jgi:hypothetical protein
MPDTLTDNDWTLLLEKIRDDKCTPFLGAGTCSGLIPLGGDLARQWAKESDFPFDDKSDLARVAQFISIKMKDTTVPKTKLAKMIKNVAPPDFNILHEPHSVIADLPLSVFMTTNYDSYLTKALEHRNKSPTRVICRWNSSLEIQEYLAKLKPEQKSTPTPQKPMVFHLHGISDIVDSMVLSEDDYLDFLINISKDQKALPARIQRAFSGNSLLFVGYRIADWDFRVLFRSLVTYLERSISHLHISVQLPPEDIVSQETLDEYFAISNIRVYWGTCEAFVGDLSRRWEAFRRQENG